MRFFVFRNENGLIALHDQLLIFYLFEHAEAHAMAQVKRKNTHYLSAEICEVSADDLIRWAAEDETEQIWLVTCGYNPDGAPCLQLTIPAFKRMVARGHL